MPRTKKLFDLPSTEPYISLRHKPLPEAKKYQLYENGQLFSRRSGMFVTLTTWREKSQGWSILKDNGGTSSYNRDRMMMRLFNPYPSFEGVKSAKLQNYSEYIFYSNGKVFSIKSMIFLKVCNINGKKGVCLLSDQGFRTTVYIDKVLKQLFEEE